MCRLTSVLGIRRGSWRCARTAIVAVVGTLMAVLATATPAAGQQWIEEAKLRASDAAPDDT